MSSKKRVPNPRPEGFTDEEQDAMKERAKELKAVAHQLRVEGVD